MGWNKYAWLVWLLANERRSPASLRKLQNRKLAKLIRHAYANVPYYRELMRERGLAPADVETVADLGKLPILTKKDLQQGDPARFRDQRCTDITALVPIKTSGSSGISLQFYVDSAHNELRKAQFLRAYLTNGMRFTDRIGNFRIKPLSSPSWFQRLGLLRHYQVSPIIDLDAQVDEIRQLRPTVFMGRGSSAARLASHLLEKKITDIRPRRVFTDSELLTTQSRQRIMDGFDCEVIDIYGTFETENIAYECQCHAGYHIAGDCVVMEFLRDGRPVGPGEEGEIVCTVLHGYTMPFIRYNLGDVGSYTDNPCVCGRTLPLMSVITGRADDMLMYPDGSRRAPWDLLVVMQAQAACIHEYQVVQEALDRLRVLVVPGRDFCDESSRQICSGLQAIFPDARIDIELVMGSLARERSGKLRAFRCLVGKAAESAAPSLSVQDQV